MKAVYKEMEHNCELRVRRKLKSGREWFRIYNNNISDYFKKENISKVIHENVIIRWGNRIAIDSILENKAIVYNNITCLEKISNKKLSRELMVKHGVPTPFYQDKDIQETIDGFDMLSYPIIIRPLVHAKGKNFFVIDEPSQLVSFFKDKSLNDYYCAPFLNKTQEFRVHCGLGKVLSVLEKPKPSDPNVKAWNRAINGDPFVYIPWSEYRIDLCVTALNACKALEADFAAVDIIIWNNKPFVLELNSSPTLISNDYTVSRYAKLFDYIHRHTKTSKLKHWDYSKFKNAQSLAWKNFQLESEENVIE
jgi:glutathione synthase/RimK-type ligase-like ATP-grasp enzyme